MKPTFKLTVLLIAFTCNLFGSTVFKIKLTEDSNLNQLNLLKKVEHTKYLNSKGNSEFYLSKIFPSILEAEKELVITKNLGFIEALIVVVKEKRLLSKVVGERHIQIAKRRELSAIALKSDDSIKPPVKKHFFSKRKVKKRKKASISNSNTVNQNNITTSVTRESLIKEKEIERKKLEDLVNETLVDEQDEEIKNLLESDNKNHKLNKPIYRIQLLETNDALSKKAVEKINNIEAAVKVFEKRYSKIYTVNFYKDAKSAERDLESFQDLGFKAIVVGDYKSLIISKGLAIQISNSL